ncbi:MAG: arsenite methyltransferase [Acidimicrobiales bacterium]
MTTTDAEQIRTAVRDRYAAAARSVTDAPPCCTPDTGVGEGFGAELYAVDQTGDLPPAAALASLGCGNPTALATLLPGQTVLDLGSGGGIDVLLSARRVGPTGKVYGLDMTPEMLELARRNQAEAGVENVEFLLGTIEEIPLPDASVDVIISNCVVNLAADKDVVLREAFRVLKPGGLFAVSDVVLLRPLSAELTSLMGLWTGCVAGALVVGDYEAKLEAAGFDQIEIGPTLVHDRDAVERLAGSLPLPEGLDRAAAIEQSAGAVANAFIRARRPA